MSTRRGWPATVGELEAVLRHLDIAQGADAQVRDGQLWIRHTPTQPWVAAVRIPAALAARARRWVATYVAAATQGAPVIRSNRIFQFFNMVERSIEGYQTRVPPA